MRHTFNFPQPFLSGQAIRAPVAPGDASWYLIASFCSSAQKASKYDRRRKSQHNSECEKWMKSLFGNAYIFVVGVLLSCCGINAVQQSWLERVFSGRFGNQHQSLCHSSIDYSHPSVYINISGRICQVFHWFTSLAAVVCTSNVGLQLMDSIHHEINDISLWSSRVPLCTLTDSTISEIPKWWKVMCHCCFLLCIIWVWLIWHILWR